MYKYGRGMWKNIESGNELSWVIGNGIGGYANHTVLVEVLKHFMDI